MRVSEAKKMTGERREKTLSRLFQLHMEGLRQSLRALEARRFSVAAGTLDRLSKALADISILMLEGKEHSLHIEVKIKELLALQKKTTEAIKTAIQLKSVKDAKAFCRWGVEYDEELAALA